jgi:hypothetical protein
VYGLSSHQCIIRSVSSLDCPWVILTSSWCSLADWSTESEMSMQSLQLSSLRVEARDISPMKKTPKLVPINKPLKNAIQAIMTSILDVSDERTKKAGFKFS